MLQLLITFTEPVEWVVMPTSSGTVLSGMLLTNAVFVNATSVESQTPGAAYFVWLQSWPGALVSLEVQASAYRDMASNPGLLGRSLQASAA